VKPSTIIAGVIGLFVSFSAWGWTPVADERIATRASRLAPPDMRLLITKYDKDFKRGLQLAARAESDAHRRARTGTQLSVQLDAEISEAVHLMRNERQVGPFVEKLGVIAHLLAAANNPFHAPGADPRLRSVQKDYESYFERRMGTYPTVFYGLRINRDVPGYLDRVVRRTDAFVPLLNEEYFRGGRTRSSKEFDDRSTAYGVASISYSRAVTDVINVYYYIWREAGGDVRTAAVLQKGNLLINEPSR
jgi:hypothetical protein